MAIKKYTLTNFFVTTQRVEVISNRSYYPWNSSEKGKKCAFIPNSTFKCRV